ncbi:MAG: hypothetical protein WKF71_11355 [Pyrinomonadaceae bacterium]
MNDSAARFSLDAYGRCAAAHRSERRRGENLRARRVRCEGNRRFADFRGGRIAASRESNDIGLLFTVDEEQVFDGRESRQHASELAAQCEYLINGEPTDNDLAIGSKGVAAFLIKTEGVAAHSAYPEHGRFGD